MAVDLKSAGLLHIESFVIMDKSLVILERDTASDRMRRILLDRVESVILWRAFPWGRAILAGALTALPALGFAAAASTTYADRAGYLFFAILFAAVFLVIELRYLICSRTHIRIIRDGVTKDIVVIARPGKVRRFVRRLLENTRATQEAARTTPASDTAA